jgi:hypothetical protein
MSTRFPMNDFRSFNSPFEVLFNFPSRYLYPIDPSSVFSLGWRLPPLRTSLSRSVTQIDSNISTENRTSGTITPSGLAFQPYLTDPRGSHPTHSSKKIFDLHHRLFPFRSPLIRESLLVSFPPLNYMLKFSG